jgi:hypothetical protein
LEQKITKAKVNANDRTLSDLYQLLQGTKSPADVLRDNARTDADFLASIERIKLPPLVSPLREVNAFEGQRIPPIPFIVRRQSNGTGDLQVSVTSDNPKLLPPSSMAIQSIYQIGSNFKFNLQVVPAAYQFGIANITIRVVDPQGGTQVQTFRLNVNHTNHAPELTNDSFAGHSGKKIVMNPLANDIDRDGDKLVLGLISMPSDGLTVVNPDGTISYTSAPGVTGRREFFYQVTDRFGKKSTARIKLDLIAGPRGDAADESATPLNLAGQNVDSQLPLTNQGSTDADDVVVTDVLSNQTDLDSGEGTWTSTNTLNRYDVNDDSFVSPLDVLAIVNSLNQFGPRRLAPATMQPDSYLDPDSDGSISPLDVLMIINHINSSRSLAGEGEGVALSNGLTEKFSTSRQASEIDAYFSTFAADADLPLTKRRRR